MEQSIFERRRQALKEFLYLPLFYLIPDEIAQKRKLDSFPRDPYYVATTPEWIKVYHSKWFQVMLLDTWGWMMWQCLGIRGGVDNYSKNDPFVLMTFSLPMWAALLAEPYAEPIKEMTGSKFAYAQRCYFYYLENVNAYNPAVANEARQKVVYFGRVYYRYKSERENLNYTMQDIETLVSNDIAPHL